MNKVVNEALKKIAKLKADFPKLQKGTKPRQYAEQIIGMESKEERRTALDQVPKEYRDLVKFYVVTYFNRRKK